MSKKNQHHCYHNRETIKKRPLAISQNFLTSRRLIAHLVTLSQLDSLDHVLEIGAGKGHITKVLAATCRKVTAVELDNNLYHKLTAKFSGTENLHLLHMDFLKMKLPVKGSYKVFANIPFSITSGILQKLTAAPNPPEDSFLIMEYGAAKRFMGSPRENTVSQSLKSLYHLHILYRFKRQDFHPMPSVDIVLLHVHKKEKPDSGHR